MEESILQANYIIDSMFYIIPTKVIFHKSNENEIHRIHYEIKSESFDIRSEASENTEFSIVKLQQALPHNVKIACCQSCKHGNFCPYGNNDNEIFCLKDIIYNDKMDLCELFTTKYDLIKSKSRKLIHFCESYEPICHNKYYTYNDWGL